MRTTTPRTDEDYDANGQKSAGRLMKEVTQDLSTLIRKEIELAKQEIGSSVSEKIKGAVVFVIAAVLGLFALIFLLFAIRDGLAVFVATWIADLATFGVLAVVAGAGAMVAKRKLTKPISSELTKKTVREDLELAKSIRRR